ncbi:hypothetical protein B5X24_HaOG208910 [Helicoverpa armigera]|nr:hypothetical protein B5X24_HaOG208910 [Helicoverpa armigera]
MEMSGNEIVLPSDPRSDRRHDLSGKHGVKSATGQAGAGNQAPPGNNDTGRPKIKLRNKFRVGTWNVRGLQAAVVQSYIYLGSTINNTGSCEEEIRRRCAVTRSAVEKLKKIWRDRRITKNTKVRLMRCLVFPIFLYGAETWTIRQKDRSRIDALEMWCWRRLLRISWTEHRTNVSILKELHIKQRLSSIVQLRTLKMFGHIIRNEDSMERLVVQGRIEGQRPRGRSPTRWTDLIKSVTSSSIVECARNATSREKWREIARAATRDNP